MQYSYVIQLEGRAAPSMAVSILEELDLSGVTGKKREDEEDKSMSVMANTYAGMATAFLILVLKLKWLQLGLIPSANLPAADCPILTFNL